MKRTKWIAFLCFAFLMAGLGANDALRGIFALCSRNGTI